jgi:hypothetical protein
MNIRFFSLLSFLLRVDASDPDGAALVRNDGWWVRCGLHNQEVPALRLAHELSETAAISMARTLDHAPVPAVA